MNAAAVLLAGLLALPMIAHAADPQGLDLTMQVVGKGEKVDDRIVNRIELPVVGGLLGGVVGGQGGSRDAGAKKGLLDLQLPLGLDLGALLPPPPTPQEYQQWVEQYRAAQQERRAEAWERYRAWQEQQRKRGK